MKRLIMAAVLLISGACTEPDLSTPEGRAEHARLQAVNAKIWKDAWDSFPKYTICSGHTTGGYTTLVCQ